MPIDLLRDSVFGQLVNYASKGKLLPYEDQKPGYVVPARYLLPSPSTTTSPSSSPSSSASSSPSLRDSAALPTSRTISQSNTLVSPPETLVNQNGICKQIGNESDDKLRKEVDVEKNEEPLGDVQSYPYLVTFEENDQDRPL